MEAEEDGVGLYQANI